MINARILGLAAAAAVLSTGFSTLEPAPGYAMGVNQDSTRQRCEFYRTKALFGNQKARAGEISQRHRVALWLRYKDCVGTKDYLVPAEFKRGGRYYHG
ncbi:MAG: hypothetical protein ACR2OM_13520 [Aestuariivirgaceae bacterium]